MIVNFYERLTRGQIECIHYSALRVLHEVGVRVESAELLLLLAEWGAEVDRDNLRVRFAPKQVEQFIADSEKYDWQNHQPRFGCYAGIYACLYLNPDTDTLETFTEDTLGDYIRLGNALPEVGHVELLGLPFIPSDIPAPYAPLAEKLYAWRFGASPSGTVQFTGLTPYLIDIYARYAEEKGQPIERVFGAVGHLISPLRLARGECEQLLYFHSRGLRMGIGAMCSMGGSTPVTPAGAAVLRLAETLFLSILQCALWGGHHLRVGGFGVVMDMRSAHSMGGRPELAAINGIMGQVARYYGVGGGGGGGLSDAKEPSCQAGTQKAMLAVAGLLSGGSGGLDAGLLSLDEICSPEQMVYDAEMVSALRHMIRSIDTSEKACAIDDIAAVGPGGWFPASDLTAERFREELWEPTIWDRQALQDWRSTGARSERQRVKERIRTLLAAPWQGPSISEACERDLRAIIKKAIAANAAETQ